MHLNATVETSRMVMLRYSNISCIAEGVAETKEHQ